MDECNLNNCYKYDERDVFIRGEHVLLKGLTEEDVLHSNWYGWFNDEKTCTTLQKHYSPNTLKGQIDFLNSLKTDKSKVQLGIICKEHNCLIGCISVQGINPINRTAELSLLVGESKFRNLMYSEESVELALKFAFETLNLNKLHAGILDKKWADFFCKRFHFCSEGIFRDHVFKNGQYLNVYNIGLLAKEYYAHKK